CSIEDMEKFARKILDAFNEPFNIGRLKLKIEGSMGISVYPDDSSGQFDLVKFADRAMYDSKKYPGNKYQFYCKLDAHQAKNKKSDLKNIADQ
ncbi:MAG: diguanylate cyclase domain-containing protein, partial [Candidatus Humimicrobiaceae bacterium]